MPSSVHDLRNPFRILMNEPPIEPTKRIRSQVWVNHARRCADFCKQPHDRSLTVRRLERARFIWISLVRHIESRTKRDDNGLVESGGWSRDDFLGMIDWYRTVFAMAGWWEEGDAESPEHQARIDNSHKDGVWLTALLTSPWFERPEFDAIKGENKSCLRDNGRSLRIHGVTGLPLYPNQSHESDEAMQEFLDIWVRVANSAQIPMDANNEAICGQIKYRVPIK